ncbi:MAG: PAS domain S-box protein [Actinobacteria bacterium]|nr:PAS domain S-box protein [Actinomycetota bacterium]
MASPTVDRSTRDQEVALFLLAEDASDLIARYTPDGTCVYVSPSARLILGYEPEELIGGSLLDFIRPEDRAGVSKTLANCMETSEACSASYRVRCKDGSYIWFETTIHLSRDADTAELVELHTNSRDVTERKHTESALREAEERFRSAFDFAAIGMALLSEEGRFIRVNRSLCRFLGLTEYELLAKTFQEITHPEDLEKDVRYVQQILSGEIDHYQMEKRYVHAEGHYVWGILSVSLTTDSETGRPMFISQIQDITDRKAAEAKLADYALHDALTGLPNRRLLWDRVQHALDRSGRRAESLAVLFMDLDDFKTINDRFGHSVGDDVLRQVADRLTSALRSGDTLARLGGDEFVIVCEDLLDVSVLDSILTRIDEVMAAPVDVGPLRLRISLSTGVALPEQGAGVDDVLAQADRSMYRMKRSRPEV